MIKKIIKINSKFKSATIIYVRYIAINYVVMSLIITLAVIKKEKYIEYKNQLR